MSASKLSDLLPIPDGVADPHAYQVFGLAGGERDAGKIKAAVAQVYSDLKTAKEATDPKLWKKAAKIAERAKSQLSDPKKRAKIDAKLNISAAPAGAPPMGAPPTGAPPMGAPPMAPTNGAPAADPLAGMLPPGADPLAGMLPPTNPASAGMPPQPAPGMPVNGTGVPVQPAPGSAYPPAVPGYPGAPAAQPMGATPVPPGYQQPPAYPPQPQGYPGQPQQGYPAQPQPGYPAQPQQAYPGQPQQAYPAHPPQTPQPGYPQAAPQPVGVNQYGQPMTPGGAPQTAAPVAAPIPPQPPASPVAAPKTSAPVFKAKKGRRKKSGNGTLIFGLIGGGLAVLILGLIAFNLGGGKVTVGDPKVEEETIGPAPSSTPASKPRPASRPRKKAPKKQHDPVMGDMAGGVEPPPRQTTSTGIRTNEFSPVQDGKKKNRNKKAEVSEMAASPMIDGMQTAGIGFDGDSSSEDEVIPLTAPEIPGGEDLVMRSDVVEAAPIDPDATFPITPPSETGSMEMTEADVKKANQQLKMVKKLILDAKWVDMKPAADQLTDMELPNDIRDTADALYNLADLATYYRGGVQRGLGTLQSTQDFEIAGGLRVIVVDVSHSSITILFNKQNRTYSIDELPFSLAEKIASFAMASDKPDTIAAMHCYQAISKKATPEHREASAEWLEMLDEDLEAVDGKAVAKLIRELF